MIPFAGEATAAAAGVAAIARIALVVGEAGNAAVTVAEIVENPESAPFATAGLLVGAAGLRGGSSRQIFPNVASAREQKTSLGNPSLWYSRRKAPISRVHKY